MDIAQFRQNLLAYVENFRQVLTTEQGDWTVKGFIDIYQNIYTISVDTKVISKIVELMLLPVAARFAREQGYRLILSEHQNHYPDMTFIAPDESKIALDLKSTYRLNAATVSGFTLGTFTGYFRQRRSSKNITFPYEQYAAHFVLGVIYTRTETEVDERRVYQLSDLHTITSVAKEFTSCCMKNGVSPVISRAAAIPRISAL